MRLLAISDVHVGYPANLATVRQIPAHPDDWLALVGDIGETVEHLRAVFDALVGRFAKLIWVPGNHELWTTDGGPAGLAKYDQLVALCREYGVLCPEDPYPRWPGSGPPTIIAPLFLLYDYSFGPEGSSPAQAIAWAREAGIVCTDERLLHPTPYPSREAWCGARVAATARRLDAVPDDQQTVLLNHWPLRLDLVRIPRVPRFVPWCGTRRTEDWHRRYRARVVVSGHLHVRATDWRDSTRFEEVALGYPRQWKADRGAGGYLREILPGPPTPSGGYGGPIWHR